MDITVEKKGTITVKKNIGIFQIQLYNKVILY